MRNLTDSPTPRPMSPAERQHVAERIAELNARLLDVERQLVVLAAQALEVKADAEDVWIVL